jgi:dolichol-phosphate mannosyltransferase
MDADLSHDAAALPAMLDALGQGADVVIGSRYVDGGAVLNWPLGRRLLSRGGNWYAGHALRTRVSDLTSAFRAYRASVLETVDLGALRADGYGFLIELAHTIERGGAKVVEVPITFVNRFEGRSKMSARIALESLRVVTSLALAGPPREATRPIASAAVSAGHDG